MSALSKFIAVVVTAQLLVACNFAASLGEAQASAEAVANALEKDIGSKPFVGWNVHNGKLVNVNVVFDGAKVSARTVRDLETVTRAAVGAHFKEQPSQLMVSVRWEK
jgi:hypothetical protein